MEALGSSYSQQTSDKNKIKIWNFKMSFDKLVFKQNLLNYNLVDAEINIRLG